MVWRKVVEIVESIEKWVGVVVSKGGGVQGFKRRQNMGI